MSKHMFYIVVDKDIDLDQFIEVYNVSRYREPEVGLDELNYEIEVDDEFYQHIHIVEYGFRADYNVELQKCVVPLKVDDNFYTIPSENEDEELELFFENKGWIGPECYCLDKWWNNRAEAESAIEEYINSVAEDKAEEYIRDPWRNYD